MDPTLSAAQFSNGADNTGPPAAGGSAAAGLSGPLGSSGTPGALGNSSSGLSGSFAGGMGSGNGM